MSEALSATCDRCGTHIHGGYFTLLRNVERTEWLNEDRCETIISDSAQLKTFCPGCGPAPAFEALERAGVQRVTPEAGPPDRPCTKCGVNIVQESAKHVAYQVAEECYAGASVEVIEVLSLSPVCATCEKALESGELGDIASPMQLDEAANDGQAAGGAR